jgi:hypothetical protein
MTNTELTNNQKNDVNYNAEMKRIGSTFIKDCAEDAKPKVEKLGADLFSLAYRRFLECLNYVLAA